MCGRKGEKKCSILCPEFKCFLYKRKELTSSEKNANIISSNICKEKKEKEIEKKNSIIEMFALLILHSDMLFTHP